MDEITHQFDTVAATRRQVASDVARPDTSLHRTLQRQPGTSFASRGVPPELDADRACVDRYDYMLFGCEQFAKISLYMTIFNLPRMVAKQRNATKINKLNYNINENKLPTMSNIELYIVL